MNCAIPFSIFLLTFAACGPGKEGDRTAGRTQAEAAMTDSVSADSMPADNTQALDTAQRSGKAE